MSHAGLFYDGFGRKLLQDYVLGNRRTEAAIRFAVSAAPATGSRILDIGSGIGWSSWELARVAEGNRVLGMDLSPVLTTVASRLFGGAREIRFEAGDFTNTTVAGTFDYITLLDVFEHFPHESRPFVHDRLRSLLGHQGSLVLTVPSVSHQAFLRREGRGGLQPVDEDVTEEDLERLAQDLGGELRILKSVSIWNQGDYVHAMIARPGARLGHRHRARLESPKARAERLQTKLGLTCSRRCGFLAARSGPRVCVIGGSEGLSETFIQNHREGLEGTVQCLVGQPRPNRTEDGDTLLPRGIRSGLKVISWFLKRNLDGLFDSVSGSMPRGFYDRLLARHLGRGKVDVVLAEYGPTAVAVRKACEMAKIPLVVHFHGYDAFRTPVLEAFSQEYRGVFSLRGPVVVVSRNMARQVVSLGAREDQVFVIPCGVDTELIKPGDPEPGSIIAVGRLVEKKGPDLSLRAFSQVAREMPGARLRMVGDGPLRERLEKLIHELGLTENVEMLGGVPHPEVIRLIRSSEVFVQHSLVAPDGDREGSPLSVLEAMAAGIPVVSTRHEGIEDAVDHGITGYLVEEGDVDEMARNLIVLLQNPGLARALGRAGRVRAEARFSLVRSLVDLSRVLEEAHRKRP